MKTTIKAEINLDGEVLKPDSDGYYYINLGAVNVENVSGIFYTGGNEVTRLVTDDETLVGDRVKNKRLFAEISHPVKPKWIEDGLISKDKAIQNKAKREWAKRTIELRQDRICAHIRSVDVIQTNIVDRLSGTKKILFKGWVKPMPPYGAQLLESFQNPNIATSFSIRGLAMPSVKFGRKTRDLILISTWDFVTSPGIPGSSDQGTMGYESDDKEDLIDILMVETNSETIEESSKRDFITCVKTLKTLPSSDNIIEDWK